MNSCFIESANTPDFQAIAFSLVWEYLQESNALSIKKCGFDFDIETMIDQFHHEFDIYIPPKGLLFLIYVDGRCVGLGGLKELSEKRAELKRLYLRPQYRGNGIGKKLLFRLMEYAEQRGYQKLLLEGACFQERAYHLCKKEGFYEIPPFDEIESPQPFHSFIYCMEYTFPQKVVTAS